MKTVRIAICQYNFTVGDIRGNLEKIKKGIEKSLKEESDIVVFPELSITGYPPEDLIFKPQFIEDCQKAMKDLIKFSYDKDILIIAGFIHKLNKKDDIYNSVAIIYKGKLYDVYNKIFLPNYGVFDEKRYFSAGNTIPVYYYRGIRFGVNICEDIWYPTGPLHFQTLIGDAELIINISASPFHSGKQSYRERMYSTRAGDESVILVNCNLVGGQDELVFDGCSTIYNENGELIGRLKAFEEDFSVFDISTESVFRKRLKDIRRKQEKDILKSPFIHNDIVIEESEKAKEKLKMVNFSIENLPDEIESIYKALVLGTRDYIEKNHFQNVIVAVSGGIDSALVATIAVDAIGKERVKAIFLPSRFSADISREDAAILCKNLGIELLEISIQNIFESYLALLDPVFKDAPAGVAEENLQSRIRGNIVMALSNKFGYLVLTTGNKSEMSTGYATLYGDMAGGFAVIKDVLKTTVYKLVEFRNKQSQVIPERIIKRAPSAELRENQKDSDTLPEYEILDKIIKAYVEEDKSLEEILEEINDKQIVRKVLLMIDSSEYKRRQAPPGIKITPRAFGRDRRMPITNGYRL